MLSKFVVFTVPLLMQLNSFASNDVMIEGFEDKEVTIDPSDNNGRGDLYFANSGANVGKNHIISNQFISFGTQDDRVKYKTSGAGLYAGGWDDASKSKRASITGHDISMYLDGSESGTYSYNAVAAAYGSGIFLDNLLIDAVNVSAVADFNGVIAGTAYGDTNPNGNGLNNYIHISGNYDFIASKQSGANGENPTTGIRAITNNNGNKSVEYSAKPIINIDGKYTAKIDSNYGFGIYSSGGLEDDKTPMPEVNLHDTNITLKGSGNAIKIGKKDRSFWIFTLRDGFGAGTVSFADNSSVIIDQSESAGAAISVSYNGSLLKAGGTSLFSVISKESAINIGRDLLEDAVQDSTENISLEIGNAFFRQTEDATQSMVKVEENQKNVSISFLGDNTSLVASDNSWLFDVAASSQLDLSASGHGEMTGLSTIDTDSALNVNMNNGFTWKLKENKGADADNQKLSKLTELHINNGSTLDAAYDSEAKNEFTIQGNIFSDNGIIKLNNNTPGNELTFDGDYHGTDGAITFNTALGDDSSPTDKLIISGNATGTTSVTINNAGGSGAQTINGIEVIHVGGTSDDGAFTKSGRIVAGVYDYDLVKGNANDKQSWFLKSERQLIPDPDPTPDPDPNPTPGEKITLIRPEIGSYAANLVAANMMFNTRLHDRLGEAQYTDALTGEEKVTSTWMRSIKGRSRFNMGDGQNRIKSNRYVVQIGGDIAQWSSDGYDRYHLGMMAGYATQNNNTHNKYTGYSSKGTVKGYSAGVYATYYEDDMEKSGLHIDSWIQHSWLESTVKGDDIDSEKYKSRGLTASLESGYNFRVGSYASPGGVYSRFYIEPKAQVTWMGVKAPSHIESNGTLVQGVGYNNIQTHLGARFFLNEKSYFDENTVSEFQPFIEANWIHNTKQPGVRMDNVKETTNGHHRIGELKVGVEGKVTNNLNLWGNIIHQKGADGYADTQGMLGVKYSF